MKLLRYSPILFLLVSLLGLSAFALKKTAASRADSLRALYLQGMDDLALSVAAFDAATQAIPDSDTGLSAARNAFFRARLAYKRIEYLPGYFDRFFVSKLNAPPLERVDESTLQRRVIEPEGFQVIEELLFGQENPDADEVRRRITLMLHRIRHGRDFAADVPISDRKVFEALREEVMRVAMLNLSGFDSPIALYSIPESRAALEGVRRGLALYGDDLRRRAPSVAGRLDTLLVRAIGYLSGNENFDTFDRLEFIRTCADPLYAELLAAHYALGFPTWEEEVRFTRPVRYESASMLAPDAIDPYAFSPDPRDRSDPNLAELGRILFFDPVLSHNNLRSCASCHNPALAFTDGREKSLDISAQDLLGRNAPTLVNAVFQRKYFWDGRTKHLEHQIEDVLLNHSEMRASFEEIIAKLRRSPEYRRLFAGAFRGTDDTAITKFAVTRSLASYVRSLVGMNSEFDRYLRGELQTVDGASVRGFNLFMGKAKCGTCHFPPLYNGTLPPNFLDTETEVLGIPSTPDTLHPVLDGDPGRYSFFGDEIYRFSFKTPTVRNAELTAPYMHNGVYKTLEEVIDFYDRGGGAGMGLEVPNQTLPADRLNLTAAQKADLIAFMRSLTDTAGTTGRPARLPEFPEHPEWNGRNGKYE